MNIPDSLIEDLESFLDQFVDGAPDASATAKEANSLKCQIVIQRMIEQDGGSNIFTRGAVPARVEEDITDTPGFRAFVKKHPLGVRMDRAEAEDRPHQLRRANQMTFNAATTVKRLPYSPSAACGG